MEIVETLKYNGIIKEEYNGENYEALFIGDSEEPFTEILEDKICEKTVSARYWISDTEKTKNQVKEDFIKKISGFADAEYTDNYSEITGYLWTDEELNIGGHNLIAELRANKGKYLHIEIDIH